MNRNSADLTYFNSPKLSAIRARSTIVAKYEHLIAPDITNSLDHFTSSVLQQHHITNSWCTIFQEDNYLSLAVPRKHTASGDSSYVQHIKKLLLC